jgi:hypothetical protein
VSDQVFTHNGGNLSDVPNTTITAMEPLRADSMKSPFLAVGDLGHCTATWLGDSADGRSAWFLTAAHCVEGDMQRGPFTATFTDWAGREVASGNGEYVLPPNRLAVRKSTALFASRALATDLAMLKLPKVSQKSQTEPTGATIVDPQGKPVTPPILYDGGDEIGHPIHFAGYGRWDAGDDDTYSCAASAIFPAEGVRRAAGASHVDGFYAGDAGTLFAPFSLKGVGESAKYWARLAVGDDGTALWQNQGGLWTIAGVANASARSMTSGARVSRHIDWIRSVYPGVSLPNAGHQRTYTVIYDGETSYAVVTRNWASADGQRDNVAYVVPPQSQATGPSQTYWGSGRGQHASIEATLTEEKSHQPVRVTLRGWRNAGTGRGRQDFEPMNNAVSVTGVNDAQGALIMEYHPQDNPELSPGHYSGTFVVEARAWPDGRTVQRLKINVDISVKNKTVSSGRRA